ncbi:hypothetical protein, partial [Pseudomonas sp. BC115LW]|uniref:hypothetical protein n=1 Tax=Pseudomonas sp. BC115LW TaxID=2683267 RepID=UPI001C49AAB0
AQREDFNLKRILLYRGNHGRLFQQNRPVADVGGPILSAISSRLRSKHNNGPVCQTYLPH